MSKYKILKDNEWTIFRLKNQKVSCCDCSLVHDSDYKIVIKGNRKFLFARFRRNNRATSALRRYDKTK